MRHRLEPIASERRARFRLTLPTILLPFLVVVLLGRGDRIRAPLDEREADLALASQPARWMAAGPAARPEIPWTPTTTAISSIAPLALSSSERNLRLPGVVAGAAAVALAVVLGERLYATRVGLLAAGLLLLLPAGPAILGARLAVEPWFLCAMLVALVAIRDLDESRRSASVAGLASGVAIALAGSDGLWLPALALAWLWTGRVLDLRAAAAVFVPCAVAALALSATSALAIGPAASLGTLATSLRSRQLAPLSGSPAALLLGFVPLLPLALLGVARLPQAWRSDDSLRFLLAWSLLAVLDLRLGRSGLPAWLAALYLVATLAAWGLASVRWTTAIAGAVLAGVLAATLLPAPWPTSYRVPLESWAARETARFLRRTMSPDTTIATTGHGVDRRLGYYGRREILAPEEAATADVLVLGQDEFRARTAEPGGSGSDANPPSRPRMIAQFGPWVVARVKGHATIRSPSLPGLAGSLPPRAATTSKHE
ncbi:MAG: hypothetical protein ACKO2K_06700 [Alphaproteobacteria bacterium]